MRFVLSGNLIALLATFIAIAIPGAAAQTPEQPNPAITIDGSKNPEKIPEWILWREIFRIAVLLDEKDPAKNQDLWIKRLNMTTKDMDKLIARGKTVKVEEEITDKAAKDLVVAAKYVRTKDLEDKLKKLDVDKEKKVLEHRDLLKGEIGKDLIDRLSDWSRRHIAPKVKVGKLFPEAGEGTPVGPPPTHP